ncbi:MAG TPA: amino acid adenylation domain-containing protein, partial [Anaerolineae bacterium]|nr:amino acid adenylation domain-containing protein [Anaerolineae bacterium]
MDDRAEKLKHLSPEKRALLEKLLKKKSQAKREAARIRPRPNQEEYPLSYAQQRMWFLYALEPESPYYNIPAALELHGHLHMEALARALGEIVARHEVLRSRYLTGPDGPEQVIDPYRGFDLTLEDISHLTTGEKEKRLRELIQAEVSRPFDIEHGGVFRTKLVKLESERHVLLLTVHHIAFDEWSTKVFMKELAAGYNAFSRGQKPHLPKLSIQYADFAWWQRRELQGDKLQAHIAYWREQLQGAPDLLELPTDRPRPPIQTYNGDTYHHAIGPELAKKLHRLAEEAGASLFMVLLAAYQALLYHYTQQDDIVVGTPVAGRNRIEIEPLIGYFVNTLAIRSRIQPGQRFWDFLHQVKQTVLEAFEHQDVPFEMLVDELQPHRNLSYTPIFQTVFSLQRHPLRNLSLGDLKIRLLEGVDVTAKFDLSLIVEDREEDGFIGVFEYNTDLFDRETIVRMAGHWERLLEGICAKPNGRIDDIELLSPEEYAQVVEVWNRTQTSYPRHEPVQALFEAQAARHPQRPALRFLDAWMTYGELNQRANQVAHYLRKWGVKRGELVALSMERSLDLIVATLGILKAGAAYLPLDANYPPERLKFMFEDADVRLALVDAPNRERINQVLAGDQAIQLVTLDDPAILNQSHDNPFVINDGDDLAYVMYTSGSTGRPKGVAVVHRGIVRLVKETNYMDFSSDQVFLLLAPISFDAATLEIWGPLLNGGLLAIMPPGTPSLADLGEMIRTYGVTTLWLTAGLFHRMVEERLEDLLRVPQLLSGGDVLSVAHVRRVLEAGKPGVMINGYGPTENTTFSTCYPMTSVEDLAHFVSIGRPIANSQVYILNERMRPVPVGVVGEIYLGGDGLALGYANRPELTAERFVPNPFATDDQGDIHTSRLYRTGDLGRWLPDGRIEFRGRRDFQVKIRGFRIELGEIEAVLGEHPDVQNVVVLARPDERGEKRLVAYIIPDKGARLTPAALRAYLSERLPDYMIPAAFVFLDAFPLNPNGKVDRRALPQPDFATVQEDRPFVAPRTPLEAHLARRFAEVLGVEKVGIHDDFFELGGDSLRGAVLINRLQDDFQEKAPVRAIFLAPTVAKMATYLQEYFPEAIQRFLDSDAAGLVEYEFEDEITRPGQAVDEAKLQRFRAIIPRLPRRLEDEQLPKNPPAVFILSPPRSGSTLLRIMLAGHPKLFAPPELDLLSFNTLGQRKAAFRGRYAFWLEGLIRAVMEVRGVDAEEARRILETYERENMSVKAFYGLLQSWLGDRILVDKTPVYSLDPAILHRMAWDFENARFIHLARHPYATIYSFIEAKLDEVFFRWEHPFTRRELAEMIWITSHQNILDFLSHMAADRHLFLRYEDLLAEPEQHMRRIADFLGLDYVPAMIEPYSGDRMTTGLEPGKQMVGDYKFYLHKRIDPDAAFRWKKFHRHDFLSDIARELAQQLGYEDFAPSRAVVPAPKSISIPAVPRTEDLPLSFAQQRLWFIDHLEPGTPIYNIPSTVRIKGWLDVAAMEQALNDVVQRHEVLRTTFHTVDGRPQQIIHPAMPVKIRVEDLSHLPPEARMNEANRRAQVFAQQPFDLSRGPLIRATLYRLAEDEHLAVLVMHHIVSDGWSYPVLIRELGLCYAARRQGREPDLPPLPIQYADFAAWQRKWLESKEAQAQLAYWKEHLAGHPTFLPLPTDHPRPPVQTYPGHQLRFDLDENLVVRLERLAREQDATLFMTLLAGFHALLHRYTGQESINVGIPHANRDRSELEGLIGFFVNTLVIRAEFNNTLTFRELLAQVQHAAIEAYAHQNAPFELVVDAIQPERDPSYTPLFQVMFAYQDEPPEAVTLPELRLEPVHLDMGIAKFDITLSAVKRNGRVAAVLEYNTDLFEEATMQRFIGHYLRLLAEVAVQPDQPVHGIDILTPEERRMLLVDWNATQRDYPRDATIPHLFARQAAATPDTPAVVFEGQTLTYAELDARANQLAHALIARGVGPESRVGVLMERSGDVAIAVMGILKAGAAYVPLDPSYPPERLRYMIEDAGLEAVIRDQRSEVRSQKPDDGSQIMDVGHWTLDDFTHYALRMTSDEVLSQPTTNPNITIHPENAAYVIYTSGSTGHPKGVVVPHRGVINILTEFHRRRAVQPGERSSWWTSLNFDVSVWEIFLPLLFGGTLVVPREEVRIDTPRFLAWMEEQAIESAYLPPFMVQPLLEFLQGGHRLPLRRLLVGVEPIPEDALIAINRLLPELQIINGYGPTEATICCTLYEIDPNRDHHRNTPIGKPYQNVQIYLLDEHMQPVPVGVPGEVYIGGDGLARGYLDRPALTAERFVPDPFFALRDHEGTKARRHEEEESEEIRENPLHPRHPRRTETPATGPRLYRTGDLARWLPDGNLMFLGRVDFQVKVRGFRIELGEIERVMETHEAIDEAVAVVREDVPGVKRIVGYFTWTGDAPPETRELRAFLAQSLPEYMIPSAFVPLDAFPRTPNDKIDRKALPKPVYHRPEEGVAFRAPVTQVEETLVNIWRELLGLETVGVDDNFFELGGDSILAIQMISRAADEGILITAKQLFQHPTIAGLAAVAETGEAVHAEQGEVTGEAPLTPIQRWFFAQNFPHPEHWNQAILLDVGQPLDPDLLAEAVAALVRHHDALRLRFRR